MKIITKVLLTALTALALTACGGSSSGDSTRDDAINKISNYAQNGGEAPTLQDYTDAGVTGVSNVDDLNAYISNLTKDDVDSPEEIQAHVNTLGVELTGNIPPIARAGAVPTTITEGETVQFSSNRSEDTDGTIVSYEWTEGGVGIAKVQSFTKTDFFSVGTHTLTLTVTDNDGATDYHTVTITVEAAPEPEPKRKPKAIAAVETCEGYGEIELSNGQIWLDRNVGASAVGEYGNYFLWDDISDACPCGFMAPSASDMTSLASLSDNEQLLLNIPNAGHYYANQGWNIGTRGVYWYTDNRGGYFTVDGVLTSIFSASPTVTATLRCIDPSSRDQAD